MEKASMRTVSSVSSKIPSFFTNLFKIISGDIDCSRQATESCSVDGSPYAVRPQCVLYPKNTSDIKHVIAFSREYAMPLTVRGGGTAATGGSLGEGIVIDMTRYFTRIRQMNMMEHTITVDAGATLDELQEHLSLVNMEIPVLCGEYGNATVGGFVATKSATASSFHAGTVREWIEGVTVVVDTGEEHHIKDGTTPSGRLLGIYQAVFPLLAEHGPTLRAVRREERDDATGYFLWSTSIGPRQLLDQLVGSEGTLGIITSVTFRVTPKKQHLTTLLVPVHGEFLETVLDIARHHRAEGLYMFDAAFRNLLRTSYPGRIPDHVPDSAFYLLITFRDNEEHSLSMRTEAFLQALPFDASLSQRVHEKVAASIMSHQGLHELLISHSKKNQLLATVGEGIIVSKRTYGECLRALHTELDKMGLFYVITGFAGSGHISVTALVDPRSPSYEKDMLSYGEKICTVVERLEGGLSAVGGDGLEKSAYLSFVYNEATIRIFTLIKDAWDPLSLFNPSKKIHLSVEYLKNHLRTT